MLKSRPPVWRPELPAATGSSGMLPARMRTFHREASSEAQVTVGPDSVSA